MKSRLQSRVVLAVVVIAAPFAIWGVLPLGEAYLALGEESEVRGAYRSVEPIGSPGARLVVSLFAVGVLVVAAALLLSPSGRSVTHRSDVHVAIPLVFGGAYLAFTYHVMTQPVVGANIGAGLMLLLGLGFVPLMVGLSVKLAWQGRRDANRLR